MLAGAGSGQSNMEDPVSQTFARNASLDAADSGEYDRVALFQTWWRPRKNVTYILPPGGPGTSMPRQTKWHSPCGRNCTADGVSIAEGSINGFSAACWYFLKGLADDPSLKDVPLVSASAPNSSVRKSLLNCTYNCAITTQAAIGTFVGGTYIEQWIQEDRQDDCQQTLCSPPTPQRWCYEKATLYNGHIAPFVNTTVAGFVSALVRPVHVVCSVL